MPVQTIFVTRLRQRKTMRPDFEIKVSSLLVSNYWKIYFEKVFITNFYHVYCMNLLAYAYKAWFTLHHFLEGHYKLRQTQDKYTCPALLITWVLKGRKQQQKMQWEFWFGRGKRLRNFSLDCSVIEREIFCVIWKQILQFFREYLARVVNTKTLRHKITETLSLSCNVVV